MEVRLQDAFSIESGDQGGLGMIHSVGKHAEHTTLNTYTRQLVLSKCSWVFFLLFLRHRVALGYTEHNQSHQIRQTASNHSFCIYVMHAT